MSVTVPQIPVPTSELPPLPGTIPTPENTLAALQSIHAQNHELYKLWVEMLAFYRLERQTPEMRTITINPGNNGNYQVVDKAAWSAKSIGILNPSNVPVYLGIGGVSARPTGGAPSCPGVSSLVLPVEVRDLELGCDPTVLLTNQTTVYIFRYVTVQPLVLRQVP
jgi:hypothetical protein